MPTQERVKHLFHYDPDSGKLFWKNPTSIRTKIGDEISYINCGYLKVCFDGEIHLAHRVIWLYETGHWPDYPRELVDHKDQDKLNNKFNNLRLTDHNGNQHNRPLNKNSTTGFKGVTKKGDKFMSQASFKGKRYYLGLYSTAEEAYEVYQEFVSKNFSLGK